MSKEPAFPENFQNFDALPEDAHVRVETVARLFGCAVVTVWRKSRSGEFPAPKKLSARITGWRVGDLRRALASSNESVEA